MTIHCFSNVLYILSCRLYEVFSVIIFWVDGNVNCDVPMTLQSTACQKKLMGNRLHEYFVLNNQE